MALHSIRLISLLDALISLPDRRRRRRRRKRKSS
jgi:hypothetical protein